MLLAVSSIVTVSPVLTVEGVAVRLVKAMSCIVTVIIFVVEFVKSSLSVTVRLTVKVPVVE